jgi:hypothetical protein
MKTYRFYQRLVLNHFGLLVLASAVAGLWGVLLRTYPVESFAPGVLVWWLALCAVSFGNVLAWRASAATLQSRQARLDPAAYRCQRWQLLLSAVYVLGCAFRAIVPRADVQRFGLFDTWISSVLVGRSVATVAELCFAAQWALLLRQAGKDTGSRLALIVSAALVPLIVVAEICSWYAVLTTAYIGNVIEESIWALSAALLVSGCWALRRRCGVVRPCLDAVIVFGAGFIVYMCMVDVPMYASRWLADEAGGREYLSLSQGLWEVGARWTVKNSWDDWGPEMPWMSLYFSVGVWSSLALVHLPRLVPRQSLRAAATIPNLGPPATRGSPA